jgi:hypothetical protein
MPRQVKGGHIKLLVKPGILIHPRGMFAAGAVNKNQALPVLCKLSWVQTAGYFNVVNINYFYHKSITHITKASLYAMEE